jgi:hypothetical protein
MCQECGRLYEPWVDNDAHPSWRKYCRWCVEHLHGMAFARIISK